MVNEISLTWYERERKLIRLIHREHPATDVYVTGTFDNWSKSEKLVKEGDIFQKSVDLPNADEKIYYKVRRRVRKPAVLST